MACSEGAVSLRSDPAHGVWDLPWAVDTLRLSPLTSRTPSCRDRHLLSPTEAPSTSGIQASAAVSPGPLTLHLSNEHTHCTGCGVHGEAGRVGDGGGLALFG